MSEDVPDFQEKLKETKKLESMFVENPFYNNKEFQKKRFGDYFDEFRQWCKESNLMTPKIQLVEFEGILGVKAQTDIQHNEMICSVPLDKCLSVDKALEDPNINFLFTDNWDFFDNKQKTGGHNNFILCVYLMYEK